MFEVTYRDALAKEHVMIETDDRAEAIFWVYLSTKDPDMTLIDASPEISAV